MISQGTSFTFGATSWSLTRVAVNLQRAERPKISTTTLAASINDPEPFVLGFPPRPDEGGSTVEIDFVGGGTPTVGAIGALAVSGGASYSVTAATCVSASVTASVGDLVRGTASFRVPSPS